MALIQEIRAKIKRRQYEFSKHAVDQSIIRDLSVEDMEDAVAGQSEIIEDYPYSVQLSESAACQNINPIPA